MILDKIDKDILNLLCNDNPLKTIPDIVKLPRTSVNKRMAALKIKFEVETMQGLIFEYTKLEEL